MTAPASRSGRRALAREARDAFPPLGIWGVRDRVTGKVRVGASRNVDAALNRMQFELRLRNHKDRALQADWNAGGPGRFEFFVLERLKERADPDFDYAAELELTEQIHREALAAAGTLHA